MSCVCVCARAPRFEGRYTKLACCSEPAGINVLLGEVCTEPVNDLLMGSYLKAEVRGRQKMKS